MIELKVTIETTNGCAGAEITSFTEDPPSDLKLQYLKTLLPNLKREDNEIALAAERLLSEHVKK